jgi:ATP citrate (pro-S)-lyase
MSAKAIREASGKELINRHLPAGTAAVKCQFASVTEGADWTELLSNSPWLKTQVKEQFICKVGVGG